MPDLIARIAADGAAHPDQLNAAAGLGVALALIGIMCLGAMALPILRRLRDAVDDAADRYITRHTNRPSAYELLTYGGDQ